MRVLRVLESRTEEAQEKDVTSEEAIAVLQGLYQEELEKAEDRARVRDAIMVAISSLHGIRSSS